MLGMMANMVTVSIEEFEELVANALDAIPEELRAAMDNVVVLVDDSSPPGPLFGLYQGVPLTKRSRYSASTPDRITIFKATICNACGSTQDVERQVRKTVIHEVGHHFGIDDASIERVGMVALLPLNWGGDHGDLACVSRRTSTPCPRCLHRRPWTSPLPQPGRRLGSSCADRGGQLRWSPMVMVTEVPRPLRTRRRRRNRRVSPPVRTSC